MVAGEREKASSLHRAPLTMMRGKMEKGAAHSDNKQSWHAYHACCPKEERIQSGLGLIILFGTRIFGLN